MARAVRFLALGVLLTGFSAVLSSVASAQIPPPAATTPDTPVALTPRLDVTRLNGNQPIVDEQMFLDIDPALTHDAENINGPSLVRIPSWVPAQDRVDPTAVYYLYFAHHSDDYIRMAWAANIEGPYTLYNVHADPFLADGMPGRGVLDLSDNTTQIVFPNPKYKISGTLASPDVIVDDANQQFIMYFHVSNTASTGYDSGYFNTGGQKTLVATSGTGLNFNQPDGVGSGGVQGGEPGHGIKEAYLGNAYFRVFEVETGANAGLYAFTNYGPIWKAANPSIPWDTSHITIGQKIPDAWFESPNKLDNPVYKDLNDHYVYDMLEAAGGITDFTGFDFDDLQRERKRTGLIKWKASVGSWIEQDSEAPRHFATLMQPDGKTLEVWYTSRGDGPERIFRTTMDTSQNTWDTWDTVVTNADTVHDEMLHPEYTWEGSDEPPTIGQNGPANQLYNAMRDPDLFRDDDGQVYLLYVGGGEKAIGIASVNELGPGTPEISVEQPSDTVLTDGVSEIDFGNIVGDGTAERTFVIRNLGTAQLTGLVLQFSGTHAAEFTAPALSLTSLAPNSSLSFTVTFDPAGIGTRSATLQILSNDADESPFDLSLTGEQVPQMEITVEQPSGSALTDGVSVVDFGEVIGNATAQKSFVIRNDSAAPLNGINLQFSGPHAAEFTAPALPVTMLAPGASLSFTVTFDAADTGIRNAILQILSDGSGDNPFDVFLTGQGTFATNSLLINGDFSTGSIVETGSNYSYEEIDGGWGADKTNSWQISGAAAVNTGGNRLRPFAQVTSIASAELGASDLAATQVILSFDWTAAPGASAGALNLGFSLVAYREGSAPEGSNAWARLNNNGYSETEARQVGGTGAQIYDLVGGTVETGTFDAASQIVTGIPGTVQFSQTYDLDGPLGSYDHIGIRIFAGDATGSTNGGILDNITLLPVAAGGNDFVDWIALYPGVGAQTGLSDDPDGDGIKNGVENFFGTAPDALSTGVLIAGTSGAGTLYFTHPQNATPADDLTATYRWSKDLATFHDNGATDGEGTTVNFTAQTDTPSAGTTTVTATVLGTSTDRLFVGVEVTQN